MKVTVDQSLCSGCGLCVETCPEVFELGDDSLAIVLVKTVPIEMEDACRDAADQCPMEAITISESTVSRRLTSHASCDEVAG